MLLEAAMAHEAWNPAEFGRVLASVPVAAWLCDRDGLITCFNGHAATLWGREPRLNDPRDRYCGSSRMFTPDGMPMDRDRCWAARALHEAREFRGCELLIEQPGGHRVAALAHAHPLRATDGRVLGVLNLLVDITDRREAEGVRNDVLQSLGHALRNPLGPVRNALHILKARGADDPQSAWALDLIERQVGELVAIIDSVSDISKLARDPGRLRRGTVDVASLLGDVVAAQRAAIERRGRRVEAATNGPVQGTADAELLARAFAALLDAVARDTPAGGTVRATATTTPGGWVADFASDVEVPASRVDTPAPVGEGSIGLALARLVASAHGGTIVVAPGRMRLSVADAAATTARALS